MERVRAGELAGGEDGFDVEVAVLGGGGADADGLIGDLGVERPPIHLGKDGGGADPQLPAGADNPNRYLPPIRNQYFVEHTLFLIFRFAP